MERFADLKAKQAEAWSSAPWEQAAEGHPQELFASIKQFMPAVAQIARVGSPDQAERAKAILDDARKKLYAILAEVDD